jgi:ABC-type sulfate transport system substrate-binding protein
VDGPHTTEARAFADFLFTNQTQQLVKKYHFRSVYAAPQPTNDTQEPKLVHFDWENWRAIERQLPKYEVIPSRG